MIVALIAAIGNRSDGSGPTSVTRQSPPTALYGLSTAQTGVRAGRFYLAFPLQPPGAPLTWATPAIRPLDGLTGLDVYIVPATTPAADPDRALAARNLDAIAAAQTTLVVITGSCDAVPPPEQAVHIEIQARFGATIDTVPIVGTPTVRARDLVDACLPGVVRRTPAQA